MSYPKIFCDIADISAIKKFNKKSIVKGFVVVQYRVHEKNKLDVYELR